MEKENEETEKKHSIWSYIVLFFSGVLATIGAVFMGRRNNTNYNDGFDNTRKQLNDIRDELNGAKENISRLDDTIKSSEQAIDDSRKIIERIKEEHRQRNE